MSGIFYKSSYKTKTDIESFIKSTDKLYKRGNNNQYLFLNNHSIGKRYRNIEDGIVGDGNNILCSDCNIFNKDELSKYINEDKNLLLELLNKYKTNILDKLNGMYSFIYITPDEAIIARDIFGIKPMYYSFIDDDIIASSEIKAILEYTNKRVLTNEGICEIIGMGPSHSLGKTIYKDIYELKPGYYIRINQNGYELKSYYTLPVYNHDISYETTVKIVKDLLTNSIVNKIKTDKNSTLLSGGIDSSIISKIVSDQSDCIDTYSINYLNSDFVKSKYINSDDKEYIKLMVPYISSHHTDIYITDEEVIEGLKSSVLLRDGPNMTDIDSSLIKLCEMIQKSHNSSFSGECSDEIFAGYPWFKDENYKSFPWIRNITLRQELLNEKYKKKIDLSKYVSTEYNNAINDAPIMGDLLDKERQLNYINLKYFMLNLLDRTERIAGGLGIDVMVPFCDKELIELLYNVPLSYKNKDNINKKLLKDAFKDELPKEVVERKKSPYPKSNSLKYGDIVKNLLLNTLKDKDSILNKIFNADKIKELIIDKEELDEPWYGQLMGKTQMMAYLYQIDYWFKEYNMRLED